jgi:hypothetical protein
MNVRRRNEWCHITDKTKLTPDEWKLLLECVTMAGVAVSVAEPSGLWGLLKEAFAGGNDLVRAKLDAKAPGDATAFKGWLRQISQHVAEASTEGGFLGIGGVQVSEAEKATLTEISSALALV